MRSRLPSLLLFTITLVTITFVSTIPATAETRPEFKLGFKALADQVPYTDPVSPVHGSSHWIVQALPRSMRLLVFAAVPSWGTFARLG